MGGGGQTTSNTVSHFEPPAYTQQGWQDYVNQGLGLASQPIPQYGGPTVAPLSSQQNQGTQMLTALATQGSPLYNAGQENLQATLQGSFANPYATTMNPYSGANNPFVGQTNPYQGDNPYLQNVIDSSNQDITDAYGRGVAAQTDSANARARSFGGSGYQEATANNQLQLARALAQNTSGLRSQNYYNSGQLAESGLNRNTSAYQNLLGMNSGLAESQLNRSTQSVEDERNRQMQAAQQALGYQGGDLQAIQAMMAGGGQQQQYIQQLLNQAQNYFNQGVQSPYQQLDIAGNVLGRASGGQGTTSQQIMGPGYSPWANALGAGIGAYSMFGSP